MDSGELKVDLGCFVAGLEVSQSGELICWTCKIHDVKFITHAAAETWVRVCNLILLPLRLCMP